MELDHLLLAHKQFLHTKDGKSLPAIYYMALYSFYSTSQLFCFLQNSNHRSFSMSGIMQYVGIPVKMIQEQKKQQEDI
jgi:hypothetical protein